PTREEGAIRRPVRQLETLEIADQMDRMVPDYVTAPQRVEADLPAGSRSRPAGAAILPNRFQRHPAPERQGLAERQRGSARGVLLPTVVGLDDLEVERGEGGGGSFDQRQQQVHSDAEIRR